jgi:DNA-binding NarL/FixJ family response regulator
LLVGQHALVREGLRRLLEREYDVEVIAEAASGKEALRALERFHPDVALVEMALPTRFGIEVTRTMKTHWSATRIVALLMEEDTPYQQDIFPCRPLCWHCACFRWQAFHLLVALLVKPISLVRLLQQAGHGWQSSC